jgi:hypothetical protein
MLFWLFAQNKPSRASALYPYVQTRASGISCARKSAGQKTVRLSSVEMLSVREVAVFDLKIEKIASRFLPPDGELSLRLPLWWSSHVRRGWPRRPWMKMMLGQVRPQG